ncbi:hypothetical protein CPLU01_14102 [Colletotrichum plurivorum]|uniref:Uncharacterized protein n=1 Tax=Colletotrichum plurivorum TaxID=2175906 RepID=A0A8H6JLP3_9PEZI|nr:hypothetical protein CPLU01_14102 [Colletotrichum plurivorum]
MSSSGNSSGSGSNKPSQYGSGGYTYAWGSKGNAPSTYIDSQGWKRNTSDNNRTYGYPPRKYNPNGTPKGGN